MHRFLVIDQNQPRAQQLGLACLDQNIATAIAGTFADAAHVLDTAPVSLIAVDASLLDGNPRLDAARLEKMAPGIPRVAFVAADASLEERVGLELAGFRAMVRTTTPDELVKEVADGATRGSFGGHGSIVERLRRNHDRPGT